MYLKKITAINFRNSLNSSVHLHRDLTVLVGENNGGKSTIIDSIRLLTYPLNGRRERYPEESDITRGQNAKGFEVEGTFSDLSQEAKGSLVWALPTPKENNAIFGLNYDSQGGFKYKTQYWAGKFKAPHHDTSFTDIVRHVYLPPLRDAHKSLGSGSAKNITTLLQHFLAEEEVDGFLAHVKRSENPHRVVEEINQEIATALSSVTSGVRDQKASLDFGEEELFDVARDLKFRLSDAGIDPEEIARSGLGYANLLYMATVVVELSKAKDTDLTIFLVEEPEAHLHPQLQALVLEFLQERARESRMAEVSPGDPEGRIQVVVTTHSPNLAAGVGPEHLVIVKSLKNIESRLRESRSIPVAQLGIKPKILSKIERVIDVTKSEMLFGSRGVLVEGIAELLLFPVIAKHSVYKDDKDAWLRFRGASLISVDGVDFMPYILLLLGKFDDVCIYEKLVVVTDEDPAVKANKSEYLGKAAENIGSQDKLKVFTNKVTLEHELFLAGNEEILKKSFFKIHPKSRKKWDKYVISSDIESRANEFMKLLSDSNVRKGSFAGALARLIAEGDAFSPPEYIENAILELDL